MGKRTEEEKRIDHSKIMRTAKERGASAARMRALMKMEVHRRKKREEKIKKTIDRPIKE
jgi:hypothetical protein